MNINLLIDNKIKIGLILCTSGSGQFLVNNKRYTFERGTISIVSPLINVYQIYGSDDFEATTILESIDVIYPGIRPFIPTIVNNKIREQAVIKIEEKQIEYFTSQQQYLLKKKVELESSCNIDEKKIISSIIQLIEQQTFLTLIQLFISSATVLPIPDDNLSSSCFADFIYCLNKNFKTQRNVAFYAHHANISVSHFSRLVKEQSGEAPSTWIAKITILNTKILLDQSKLSIKEIASELNFPEQFTFRKYFKSHTSLSPSEYRKNKLQ